jgi:hypothetical protein
LQKPFPTLKKFADGLDLKNMSHEHHSHIPYVILYMKALDAWREKIGDSNALPLDYKKRKDFLSVLMDMQVHNEQGIYNEGNFVEAKQQLFKSFSGIEVRHFANPYLSAIFSWILISRSSLPIRAPFLIWMRLSMYRAFGPIFLQSSISMTHTGIFLFLDLFPT